MSRRINLADYIGQKFGYFTFLKEHHFDGKRSYITVLCVCGVQKNVQWENLKRGRSKSCGCKMYRTTNYTKHPLYPIWIGIKNRCNDKSNSAYKYYGGRGVRVSDKWNNNFPAFRDWCLLNGWKKGLEVDKDMKGNGLLYSPETCSITTHRNNMRNRVVCKLNEEMVSEIRSSTEKDTILADKYSVTKYTIQQVRNNKIWA